MTVSAQPWPVTVEVSLIGLSALAFAAAVSPPLFMINETPSLPRGIYVRVGAGPAHRGDVVALAPPPASLGYLASLEAPRHVRLIKRVAAVGGERVCAGPGRVRTPQGELAVRSADRRHVPLPAWSGCGRLEADRLFLAGDTPTSFDSRYFGPVRQGDLDGVYRLALAW